MPNSGAFRSLHCLIYKVLALTARRRNICYLITNLSVCQALFSTFFKSFVPEPFGSFGQLIEYIRSSSVCQVLFSTFSKFFQRFEAFLPLSRTAWLFYQTFHRLSSTFFDFFQSFFRRSPSRSPGPDSLPNIADSLPNVNTFFQKNRNFFFLFYKTFPAPRDIVESSFRCLNI